MKSKEKLLQLRHDFYTNDSLDYDSISYFTDIEKDLDFLEALLSCFKKDILDATDVSNHRGDNIIADLLRDELGSIKLNELKRRLENDK